MSLSETSVFLMRRFKSVALLHLQNRRRKPRQAWHVTMALIHSASYFLRRSFTSPRSSVTPPRDSPLPSDKQLNLELNENRQKTSFIPRSLTTFEALIKLELTSWLSELPMHPQNLYPISSVSIKYLQQKSACPFHRLSLILVCLAFCQPIALIFLSPFLWVFPSPCLSANLLARLSVCRSRLQLFYVRMPWLKSQ